MWKVYVVDSGEVFLFEIWRDVNFFVPKLTRCRKVYSETAEMKNNYFKIWEDEKNLIQNHAFHKNFLIQNHAF